MKKIALIGLAFLVAVLFSFSAQAKPVKPPVVNEGVYCTEGFADDYSCQGIFSTKFWKEKFFGGGPGDPGNVLMAIGQGFTLQNVVLQEPGPEPCTEANCAFTDPVELTDPLYPVHPCNLGGWGYDYKTTYSGGFLRLNKGPLKLWVNKGKLKDSNLTATNYSAHNAVDGSLEHFCLVIEGNFDNAENTPYKVIATFDVDDDGIDEDNYQIKYDEEGNAVFQRGYDFDAVITIGDVALPE